MNVDEESQSGGIVLEFRLPSQLRRTASKLAPSEAQDERRRRSWDQWSGRVWMVVAWVCAIGQVQLAVERRVVFSTLDSLAFALAVVMPIMRARSIVGLLRDIARALRLRRRGRALGVPTSA